jgi:hypothetical protein
MDFTTRKRSAGKGSYRTFEELEAQRIVFEKRQAEAEKLHGKNKGGPTGSGGSHNVDFATDK